MGEILLPELARIRQKYNEGRAIDWFDSKVAEGRWFLEHATQVKNIWVPYGE